MDGQSSSLQSIGAEPHAYNNRTELGCVFDMYREQQHVENYGPARRSIVSDGVIIQDSENGASRSTFFDPILGEEFFIPKIGGAGERYLNSSRRRILELIICWSLLIFLLPLLGLIALGVRLTSPGPIFFKQLRYGQGMTMFELVKFRSMYWTEAPEPSVAQVTQDDPRVTPLGRFLRCTSMDELPQLVSVIKGEMSLIGPRPHAVQHDMYYRDLIPNYCVRLRARPGITGLAQVSGARGGTPRIEDMERRVQLDLLYLQQASLSLDCRILLKSFKEVFKSDAAY
jgi:putative colanic acid biosynthesis UDP-glucose lipid carrier transferase